MKLYDCVLFYNELAILEVRMHELKDLVDVFVVVEAKETFSGKPKPINFNPDAPEFAPFKDRIRHVIVESLPYVETDKGDWTAEEYQRDCLVRGLYDVTDDDIIMLSDVDEIPRATAVAVVKRDIKGTAYRLGLSGHSFYFNSVDTAPPYWESGPLLARYSTFKAMAPHKWKARTGQPEIRIDHAGWHFTYLGGKDAIVEKIGAYSHRELNNETGRSKWIKESEACECVTEMNAHYPQYVRENHEKFKNYIRRYE